MRLSHESLEIPQYTSERVLFSSMSPYGAKPEEDFTKAGRKVRDAIGPKLGGRSIAFRGRVRSSSRSYSNYSSFGFSFPFLCTSQADGQALLPLCHTVS